MTTDQTDHRADPVQAVAEALRKSRMPWGTHSDRWGDAAWQHEFWAEVAEYAVAAARPLIEREAKVEALMDAADELEALVDSQHPEAVNPDQWLRDRAYRIEQEGQ